MVQCPRIYGSSAYPQNYSFPRSFGGSTIWSVKIPIKPRNYRFCPRSCATFLKSIAKTMADEKSIPVVDNHVTVSASESAQADSVIKEVPQKRWVSYLWDTFDKSPEERRFLFKLDAAVLTFASLGTFIISRDV